MSDYVKSTNFYIKDTLLSGNPDKIVKGSELDTEFNNIATAVASKANYASPALTGIPTAPTAPQGTNSSQIATCAFVFANSVPVGAIMLWSGSSSTIPASYALCDGTNGTPNLRDKFVIGAGTTYAVAATGGTKDAVVVSHTHTLNTTGAHTHVQRLNGPDWDTGSGGGGGAGLQSSGTTYSDTPRDASISTASAGDHTHTITTEGVTGTDANLPPYYALCYIMRVS